MVFVGLPSVAAKGKPQKLTGQPEEIIVEPIGHAFATYYRTQILNEEADPPVEDLPEHDVAAEEEARMKKDKKKNKKKKNRNMSKRAKEDNLQDHYEVLELDDTYRSTPQQIEASYRKLIVQRHPDKNPGRDPAEFIAVQEAYDTLMNVDRRRVYDSQYDTNDSVPSGSEKAGEFYEVFGKCFDNNARWSEKQPMPRLGDKDTPMEEVDRFYEEWHAMKTWRDFSMDCEHSENHIRSCDEREVRRIMQRENDAFNKRKKKDEVKRLVDLVDLAYKLDPRIRRRKLEKEVARAKEEERKKKEAEEKAAAEAAAKAAAEAAEAAARLDAKAGKADKAKKLKNARRRLRKATEAISISAVYSEKLCANLSAEELDDISDKLEKQGEGARADFQAIYDRLTAEGK